VSVFKKKKTLPKSLDSHKVNLIFFFV